MKTKNTLIRNRCTLRGRIEYREVIHAHGQPVELIIFVKTDVGDGTFTWIPCAINWDRLRPAEIRLKKGDWVTVFGTLESSERDGIMWIETQNLERVTRTTEKKYINRAVLQGSMVEGGCLLDKGKPVMADFLLGVGDPAGDYLEVDCLAGVSVRDFISCINRGQVQVSGRLNAVIPEDRDKGKWNIFVDVTEMNPLQASAGCARKGNGGDRDDS